MFMQKELNLPKNLLTQSNMLKMAIILSPAVVQQTKDPDYDPFRNIIKVFKKATEDLRGLFMRDELIKHLWSRVFISEEP